MTHAPDPTPRTEIGSFFSWPSSYLNGGGTPTLKIESGTLLNSGRAAILEAVRRTQLNRQVSTVLLPSYYCDVVAKYLQDHVSVDYYSCNPLGCVYPDRLESDQVLVAVSYFGAEPDQPAYDPSQVILDATHDPFALWIDEFPATSVASSLRKTLPLGAAAILKTVGPQFPLPKGLETELLDGQIAECMKLKEAWLAGSEATEKDEWYSRFQRHEAELMELPPQAMGTSSEEIFVAFDCQSALEQRSKNIEYLKSQFDEVKNVEVLPGTMGLPLLFESGEGAAYVQEQCINERIYPARLWPAAGSFSAKDRALTERLLFFHCDFRYSPDQIEFMASVVQNSI